MKSGKHKSILTDYDFFQNPNNYSSRSNDASILIENYMTLHWVFHSNGILFGWDEYKFIGTDRTQLLKGSSQFLYFKAGT